MTDADKKLYDKALDDLWRIASGTPEEIDAMTTPWIAGYQEGLKAKINATTISDCPVKDEWHYPSKGEYPTTEEEVLVYLWDSFYIGTYCLDSSEINRWHFNDFDEQSDQITAWCYIEPPKEEE